MPEATYFMKTLGNIQKRKCQQTKAFVTLLKVSIDIWMNQFLDKSFTVLPKYKSCINNRKIQKQFSINSILPQYSGMIQLWDNSLKYFTH